MFVFLWKKLIASKSKDKDRARREFILNILLIALIILSTTAFIINSLESIFYERFMGENPLTTGLTSLIFIFLLFISRRGKGYTAAFILLFSLITVTIYVSYQWGADLPVNLSLFAFIIVMAGILLGTIFSFIATITISAAIIFFSYLEIFGVIHPNRLRDIEGVHMTDSFVNVIILTIIAIVSWLSNREIEKSLKRARASERELKKERDLLEIKVEERTRELKRIQLERVTQLHRFAEVGKLTSGFMHDLVNPISLISLNLHRLNRESQQKKLAHINTMLKRAMSGTRYLENFVTTARKQLQNQEIQKTFSLNNEIKHVIEMLSYKANKMHVKIVFNSKKIVKLFGNPIKFNQIAMNLILNAIDAYEKSSNKNRIIYIILGETEKQVLFNIKDSGIGIPKENLKKIFDPFFTTKTDVRGTGIGLSITQNIVKQSFHGTIHVKSGGSSGTIFTVNFPKRYPKLSSASLPEKN